LTFFQMSLGERSKLYLYPDLAYGLPGVENV
jgi:hypothetical protein